MENAHYKTEKNIEAIDIIDAYNLNFNLGNVVKYVCRCNYKGCKKSDLENTASFNRHFYDFGVPYSINFCYLLKLLTAIDAHLLKTTISTVHLRKGRSTFLIITINKTTFHHTK